MYIYINPFRPSRLKLIFADNVSIFFCSNYSCGCMKQEMSNVQMIIELLNENSLGIAPRLRGFINGKGKLGNFNNTKWGQHK